MCVGAVHDVVAVLSSLGIHFGGGSVGDQEDACPQAASSTTMPDDATPQPTSRPTRYVEHFRLDAYDSVLEDETVKHNSAP